MDVRLSVDIGGTFTDVVLDYDGTTKHEVFPRTTRLR